MAYLHVSNEFNTGDTVYADKVNTNFQDVIDQLSDRSVDANVDDITAVTTAEALSYLETPSINCNDVIADTVIVPTLSITELASKTITMPRVTKTISTGTLVPTSSFTGITSSSSGLNWSQPSVSNQQWKSVGYNTATKRFIAIGQSSSVATYSDDGDTWADVSATSSTYESICYGYANAIWVAIGFNKVLVSTDDGANWTQYSCTANNWKSVCQGRAIDVYANNAPVFVAVAGTASSNERSFTSELGVSWNTHATADEGTAWNGVCFRQTDPITGLGYFVAVGALVASTYDVMKSTNGRTWTGYTSADTSKTWVSVCYGNGLFVAIANDATIQYSSDGETWTLINTYTVTSLGTNFAQITYGNGMFIAIFGCLDSTGNQIMISTDAITWEQYSSVDDTSRWAGIAYGNNQFIGVSMDGITTKGINAQIDLDSIDTTAFDDGSIVVLDKEAGDDIKITAAGNITGSNQIISDNSTAMLVYNGATSKWNLIAHQTN